VVGFGGFPGAWLNFAPKRQPSGPGLYLAGGILGNADVSGPPRLAMSVSSVAGLAAGAATGATGVYGGGGTASFFFSPWSDAGVGGALNLFGGCPVRDGTVE